MILCFSAAHMLLFNYNAQADTQTLKLQAWEQLASEEGNMLDLFGLTISVC